MNRLATLIILCAFLPLAGCAQKKTASAVFTDYFTTPEDSALAVKIMNSLSPTDPVAENMIKAGEQILGNPYVAYTLEGGDHEQVRIFLLKTDCILFVETCFNLAENVALNGQDADFVHFADLVRQSRYRDGVATAYSDRIHYTTEWIRQQEARGLVRDLTLELGGEVYDHPISYMSRHSSSYEHLKNAATDSVQARDLRIITASEKKLNETPYSYIPEDRIPEIEKGIRTGDIIGYMSNTDGLDIAHVVMAHVHYPDGTVLFGQWDPAPSEEHGGAPVVGFMHASMGQMKVIIDPLSIADYAKSSRGINGIKVVRPL